ncbi:hypothetical protein TNCT_4171 [Trichonephila clavata]|uniref:Uncharacterized protein n=1 Tax=Trichonephila clavata TaxID=2740835 RepID=A0A8X6HWT9_TRICU|nr:hypothetical protein TNCT_4171 [Trichonephila clavata]
MDILPNKLKRKLKTPRTPRKTAKFDRLVTNLENEVNLPKDPVDLPMREDHELPMVDNNNEDNFIPILVHDEMDNKPTAADPLLENKPTAADPLLENKPTAADPLLENKPTAADPLLENKPTAVDPPLENKPTAADPLLENKPTAADPLLENKPTAVDPPLENKPIAVDPPLENKPIAADPLLENNPTAVDPPLENKPTAVDPSLENKPTAVDPSLENMPDSDDAYAVWDDPMDIDEDKKPEDKIHAVIVDNYEEPSNDEKEEFYPNKSYALERLNYEKYAVDHVGNEIYNPFSNRYASYPVEKDKVTHKIQFVPRNKDGSFNFLKDSNEMIIYPFNLTMNQPIFPRNPKGEDMYFRINNIDHYPRNTNGKPIYVKNKEGREVPPFNQNEPFYASDANGNECYPKIPMGMNITFGKYGLMLLP